MNKMIQHCILGLGLLLLVLTYPATQVVYGQNEIFLPLIFKTGSNGSGGSGTLTNGGTVEGVGGIGIGAFEDTLTATIQITTSLVSAPAEPLPSEVKVLGDFYELSTQEDTYTSTSSPFILAFPVPAGFDTTKLALALLSPGDSFADVDSTENEWVLLEGQYDPAQNLFLTTIPFLAGSGRTFVLVEHPGVNSPEISVNGQEIRPQLDIFDVTCWAFLYNVCTSADEGLAAGILGDIHTGFLTMNYPEPRLQNLAGDLKYPPDKTKLASLGYKAYIEPGDRGRCSKRGQDPFEIAGFYDPQTGRLVLCWPLLTDEVRPVTIHEYFHAIQFAYLYDAASNGMGAHGAWVIEGMATAAEASYDAFFDAAADPREKMKRTERGMDPRKVDVKLTSITELNEYAAQDFWVFMGQALVKDLSYFQRILKEGKATVKTTNTGLIEIGSSLPDGYWSWVKNQVMEKDLNFDNVLGAKCQLESKVVDKVIVWNSDDGFKTGGLDPLTSEVVELNWQADIPQPATIYEIFSISATNPDVRYKVYVEGESPCGGSIPDGARFFPEMFKSKTYYVVLSNTSTTDSHPYQLLFE